MIAVDTNVLIAVHRREAVGHQIADATLVRLVASGQPWAIPWPCVHEFLCVATHPRVFQVPTPLDDALLAVQRWLDTPSLTVLGETDAYWLVLTEIMRRGRVSGPKVHDARIAALCLVHGVEELWSADRDFRLFPQLRVRNPLLAYGDAVHES